MSGAGKTTIVKNWCARHANYKAYYYDDYEDSIIEPSDWIEWMDRGADYNEWDAPKLYEDIKNDKSNYLIVDYPFGRIHSKFSELIDKSIYLELPVNEALDRRLIRGESNKRIKGKALDLFTVYHNAISPTCDIRIDSLKNTDEILDEIKMAIDEDDKKAN